MKEIEKEATFEVYVTFCLKIWNKISRLHNTWINLWLHDSNWNWMANWLSPYEFCFFLFLQLHTEKWQTQNKHGIFHKRVCWIVSRGLNIDVLIYPFYIVCNIGIIIPSSIQTVPRIWNILVTLIYETK